MSAERSAGVIIPTWHDPRWPLLAFQLVLVLYALNFPGFSRTPSQLVTCVLTCILLDGAMTFLRTGLQLLPMSGLNTSLGILFLCDSPLVWPYTAVAAVSIASKHLLRVGGRHLFVPNNFGMVVALLFLSDFMTARADRWGGSPWVTLTVIAYGILVARRVRRLDISFSYTAAFFAMVLTRAALTGKPWLTLAAPMTGVTFHLFAYFIMTDPITTPASRRGRVVFGLSLALLDSALRALEVRHSIFYALFVLSSLTPLLRAVFPDDEDARAWDLRSVPLTAGLNQN